MPAKVQEYPKQVAMWAGPNTNGMSVLYRLVRKTKDLLVLETSNKTDAMGNTSWQAHKDCVNLFRHETKCDDLVAISLLVLEELVEQIIIRTQKNT